MPASMCRPMAILRCVIAAALLTVCGDRSSQAQAQAKQTPAPAPTARAGGPAAATTAGTPCPNPPPCGNHCTNSPFVPTGCWTTPFGPAKADVIVSPKNLLYCSGGSYALCFFSGPPNPTGQNPANRPLPCTLQGSVANCTCQVYTSGPYFVDINGILNQGAYFQTVNVCGQDGSSCANLENCGPGGKTSGCANQTQPPVCQYVRNQSPNDPSGSLIPKADLISTFSFAMDSDYRQGSTNCTGLYAGCMTAPCFFGPDHHSPPHDGEPIQCECPVANGKNQVGQPNQTCAIAGSGPATYVWSASYTPAAGKAKAKQ